MKEFDKLVSILKILRSPQGCPWDRAQKANDLKRYLLEETYELIEGIDKKKRDVVREELGDLFLILVFIAEIFREKGKFNLSQVFKKINKKLVSRHPHVFSSKKFDNKEKLIEYWINNKAKEKKRAKVLDRLPITAPALVLAGIFIKEQGYLGKIPAKERRKAPSLFLEIKDALGSFKKNKTKAVEEIIFSLCYLASFYKIDLETLLRRRVLKEAGKLSYHNR